MARVQKLFSAGFLPNITDEITGVVISPARLPDYRGEGACAEIDAAYQRLYLAQNEDEYYGAVSILIFHARHLHPVEHANLAEMLSKPFKRSRGAPVRNHKLAEEVSNLVASVHLPKFRNAIKITPLQIAKIANENGTSKEVVRREIRKAKAQFDAERLQITSKKK